MITYTYKTVSATWLLTVLHAYIYKASFNIRNFTQAKCRYFATRDGDLTGIAKGGAAL